MAEQAAIEKEREERFCHFPKSEGGPGVTADQDMMTAEAARRDLVQTGETEGSDNRPVRRFERERKK